MYFQKIVIFIILFTVSQACFSQTSKIILGDNTDISLSISLPKRVYSISDANIYSTLLSMEITNNSAGNINVFGPLENITSFKETSQLSVNDAYYTYKVERFDSSKGYWIELENDKIFNDIGYVVNYKDEINKQIKRGEKFYNEIRLFDELKFGKVGKFRIQLYLGIKLRDNAFLILSSDRIDMELKR